MGPSSHFSHIGVFWLQIIAKWGGKDARFCLTALLFLIQVSQGSVNNAPVAAMLQIVSRSVLILDLEFKSRTAVAVTYTNIFIYLTPKITSHSWQLTWAVSERSLAPWPCGRPSHRANELNLWLWGKASSLQLMLRWKLLYWHRCFSEKYFHVFSPFTLLQSVCEWEERAMWSKITGPEKAALATFPKDQDT